jgi:hypothetical protein
MSTIDCAIISKHIFILFIMSNEKSVFDESCRIRIIKNLIYFISILDFLMHYVLTIEMNVFEQIYQTFGRVSKVNSTAIPLCELPIKKYLSFSLSEMSLYIFYLSILTLLISIEAIRKSSFELYRFYIIIKFIFSIISLIFCTIYTGQMNFISTSLTIPHEINSISITIDPCLIYTREKIAIYILSIVNVFVFLISMECSKIFSFFKIKIIQIYTLTSID